MNRKSCNRPGAFSHGIRMPDTCVDSMSSRAFSCVPRCLCVSIAKAQSGFVMTEYLLATLLTVVVLFMPIPGLGESAFIFLINALRGFQANTTYIMSMP